MSGRLKAVAIAVGILYAIGVLFFVAKANSRRGLVAVPDFIERDLAIPSDEFDMFALELDKYIVMDDGADGEVASEGELLATNHMRKLRESGIEKLRVRDQRKIASFVEKELVAMDDVAGPEGLLLKAGTVLGRDEADALRDAGVNEIRAQGFGSIVGLNGTMLAVVLNFLVLTFFLYVFLWKPVVGITDARENTIAAAIDGAKEAVAHAEEVQRERSKLDRETRRERMKIIDDLTVKGRDEADEIISRARAEAGRLREKAQSALASTVEQLDRELRPELPVLANQVTTKLLGRTLRQELFEQAASRSEPERGEG